MNVITAFRLPMKSRAVFELRPHQRITGRPILNLSRAWTIARHADRADQNSKSHSAGLASFEYNQLKYSFLVGRGEEEVIL